MGGLAKVVVVIIVVGALLWGAKRLPMDDTVREILRVVVIVALVIWLVRHFWPGLW